MMTRIDLGNRNSVHAETSSLEMQLIFQGERHELKSCCLNEAELRIEMTASSRPHLTFVLTYNFCFLSCQPLKYQI
jgi:hypothetical protein